MSLLSSVLRFAKTPQGRRALEQAGRYARSPQGRARIDQVRNLAARRQQGRKPPR
jgi:hypothetical protein